MLATTPHKQKRDKFIKYIQKNISYLKQRNSILCLKAGSLKSKRDAVNIATIVVSTLLTVMETLRLEFDVEKADRVTRKGFAILPVLLTSYISVSMSILKFKRYDEELLEHTKAIEKLIYVIMRLRRVIEDAKMSKDMEGLENVRHAYSATDFDLFMQAREMLDKQMKLLDVVYYTKVLDNYTDEINHWDGSRWYNRILTSRCCRRRRPKQREAELASLPSMMMMDNKADSPTGV
jgi:hypothetical protein